MKRIATIFALFVFSISLCANAKFAPKVNSPIANSQHPRIFITADEVQAMRDRIATYYKSDFQQFISHLDNTFNSGPGAGIYDDWNDIFCGAQSYALAHLVDPGKISGINASHSADQYGEKAIDFALHIAAHLESDWSEPHHGASTLSSGEGGLASLALQVVYDWTHDMSTLSQKKDIVDRLIALWDRRYDSSKIKLENHYAANTHVYAGALCFFGDEELGGTYVTKAETMMDSFQDLFMTRQLGVAEILHEGSSDWTEGDGYSLDGFTGLMFLAAASSSALGQDLFEDYNWLRNVPHFAYSMIMPKPFEGHYYFLQQNTSQGVDLEGPGLSQLMNMSAARLNDIDPKLAGFAAWFCEESKWGQDVNEYKYYQPHIYDFYYKFVFGTKHVEKLSPEQAEISLSQRIGQMHVMRSEHISDDQTMIQFFAFKYHYPGGHNEAEMSAFNIHRFGTLAIAASNTKSSPDGVPKVERDGKGFAQNNVMVVGSDKFAEPAYGRIDEDIHDVPEEFREGNEPHVGNVEAREYKEGWHDYINYNYTPTYKDDNSVSLARRALVYLRGEVNHEYVVVMDRLDTSKEKKFLLHIPAAAQPVDGSWSGANNGFDKTNAKQVRVSNTLDISHGQMYVSAVFPEDAEIYQGGGPGREWIWPDGSALNYNRSFGPLGAWLLSDHTLQIRSNNNQFLTVMQLGDANNMGNAASVEKLKGNSYIGAYLGQERVVIFSDSERKIEAINYSINGNNAVKHLIAELPLHSEFVVKKGGSTIAEGSTGKDGSVSFEDNPGGNASYTVSIGGKMPAAVDEQSNILPEDIELGNYPNPFNPETQIHFSLPATEDVKITIYNSRGQLVRNLVNGRYSPGAYNVRWDATNDAGIQVTSGVYIYQLQSRDKIIQKKMILMQ